MGRFKHSKQPHYKIIPTETVIKSQNILTSFLNIFTSQLLTPWLKNRKYANVFYSLAFKLTAKTLHFMRCFG
jgi:hypothetical protein